MNILVNSRQISGHYSNTANLEDVLVELANTSLPKNHLVGTVRVNGKEFSELYPGQAKAISIEKINDLEITTVSPERFASAALKDSITFIKHIDRSVNKAAEMFRIYDENNANEYFAKVIESIRALVQFIDNARVTISWDFSSSTYNGKSIQAYWDNFISIIEEMCTVQENSDWIMLADLLEYEFSPVILTWQEIIREVIENNTFLKAHN